MKTIQNAILCLVLLALTSGCGSGSSNSASDTDNGNGTQTEQDPNQIIVVGAGFAGLSAAKELSDQGYDVIVLEARNRLGGRVYTDRSTGIALDMGASWIAGIRNNPITELAEEAGAELGDATDYDNIATYDFDGTPDPISALDEEDFYNKTINASRDAYRARSVESMETLFDDLRDDGEFSYLNDREYNYLVNTFYEHEYSGDASVMSAQSAWEGNDLSGGDVILPEGYDQLIDYLAEGLDVRFNTVVNRVHYDETGVVVGSNQGDFMAERVIVTVSVGVLQSGDIQFEPALPASKQQAIDNLAMGTLNKIWMIFSYAFWDTDKDTIGYVSSVKGEYTEWYYFEELSQGDLLLCFNGGEFGELSEDKSDQQLTDEAMTVLRTIYGNDIPDPSDVLVSRWHSDPYARGAYAHLKPGAQFTMREDYRSPVIDRLFFAGEATSSDYPALTEGAVRTGRQAANEIINLN